MANSVREEVVDVVLTQILNDYGLEGASLQRFDHVPDIYLTHRGMRIIIEAKRADWRRDLEKQLDDRLNNNLCDIAIGVLYPKEVVQRRRTEIAPPTPKQVRKRLIETSLVLLKKSPVDTAFTVTTCSTAEIPELISRFTAVVIADEELDEAVERIGDSIRGFVTELGTLEGVSRIAEEIEVILSGIG